MSQLYFFGIIVADVLSRSNNNQRCKWLFMNVIDARYLYRIGSVYGTRLQ